MRGCGGGGKKRPEFVQVGRVGLASEGDRHLGFDDQGGHAPAGYGRTPRVQFIGDGATWIENIASDGFKAAIFTLDCSHALGYANKVCEFLAGSGDEAKKVFRKVKDRMYEHGFARAEKYLKNKYRAHFTESACKVRCGLRRL